MRYQRVKLMALAGWAILNIGALASFLLAHGSVEMSPLLAGELETRLVLQVLILNLPISLLATLASPVWPELGAGVIVEWSVIVFLGFFQWVVVIPAITRSARRALSAMEEADRAAETTSPEPDNRADG